MLKKRLKPIYLIFLTIPIVYLLLLNFKHQEIKSNSKLNDYIYFSVKTSNQSVINLIANKELLTSWNVNSKGFKNLQYYGKINDESGFSLTFNNLKVNDTISLLGLNLYRNNQIYSLFNNSDKYYSVENAIIIEQNGIFKIIIQQSGKPAVINFKSTLNWETNNISKHFNLFVIFAFIITFLLLIILAPPKKYFVVSVILSIIIMFIFYLRGEDFVGKVNISSNAPIKGTEIFYNENPLFNPINRYYSDETKNEITVPLNIKTEGFLRFDIIDTSTKLENFQIKIKLGIFSTNFNVVSIPQKKLVLNDLVLQGNTYYITGNDPYIALTSSYFAKKIEWLIFFQNNIFLFISILFFLILLIINPFVCNLNKIKFKPAHFVFLLIPLTYCLIIQPWKKEVYSEGLGQKYFIAISTKLQDNILLKSQDQIYFSIRTSKPSLISLYNGNDSITSWDVNSRGFKYLQYEGRLNVAENFYLKVKKLSAKDTISLLSVNLFHDNKTYTLFDKNESVCKISNTSICNKPGELIAIIQKTNDPVMINMLPFNVFNEEQNQIIWIIAIIIFLISFVFAVLITTRSKYFIVSCIITSILMFFYFWIGSDIQSQIEISSDSPLNSADFFYNNNPVFIPARVNTVNKGTEILKSQVNLATFSYLRCDVSEKTKELKNFHIYTKVGILKNDWDYSTIPLEKTLMNDLIRIGDKYLVCGNDPFIALTSSVQVKSIKSIMLIRQNIFLIFTIILFLILLFAGKFALKQNTSAFFVSITFLVLISCGLLFRIFNSDSLVLSSEMRFTNSRPDFNVDSAESFIPKLDNYLKDQVSGRNNIITMNNLVEYSVFRQLLNNPNVHFGKDGWMFFIGGVCKENYENRHPLTPRELKKMKDVLLARRDWLKERDIHFYLIFPPMAYFVYEEKVGSNIWRCNKKSKLDQLLEYLKINTNLDIIDIYTPLIEAKNKRNMDLYYKNNSHWTFYGSYIAYNTMINYIKKDFPNIGEPLAFKDIEWTDFDNFPADLLKLIALDKYYFPHEYFPVIKKKIVTDTIFLNYPEFSSPAPAFCLLNKKTELPSMIMYGDSFSGFLLSYNNNNFNKSIYLWTPLFYPIIIEKEKPDMVIQEMADYTIYNILLENPPLPKKKDTINQLTN